MGALRTMDPSQYFEWCNDFNDYEAGEWIVTESAVGTTEAIVDGAGGQLAMTHVSAGAADYAQIQWCGHSAAAVLNVYWTSTKDFLMKTRFKVSDATNPAAFSGCASVDTSLIASAPADGI